MKIARSVSEVRSLVRAAHESGLSTCLVPTMGGLHSGHLSLIEKAKSVADFVVVKIFVNPTQFNNADDFENYPSNTEEDLDAVKTAKGDLVFMPNRDEMYPEGFSTQIDVTAGSGILCDAHRPGHFGSHGAGAR